MRVAPLTESSELAGTVSLGAFGGISSATTTSTGDLPMTPRCCSSVGPMTHERPLALVHD